MTGKQLLRKSANTAPVRHKSSQPMSKKSDDSVVRYLIKAQEPDMLRESAFTPAKLVEGLHLGLPIEELDRLQASFAVAKDKLALMLGLSKATLRRRIDSGRLTTSESDRVLRFARLMGKAVEVLESEDNARKWLNSPQIGLGGAVPLHYAETELGAREVEDLLGRIEYGVYS
jgi:putative toxin-antitoxin system antitoxin component (TIGR02293 family)